MYDNTDLQIIAELRKNGRMTMKELGEKVHLTGQATASRVQKLEKEDIIKRYTIDVNDKKLGYKVHAFITIYLKEIGHCPYLAFIEERGEYIRNHYKISGEGCYLVEARFSSNDELDEFLTGVSQHANYKVTMVIK